MHEEESEYIEVKYYSTREEALQKGILPVADFFEGEYDSEILADMLIFKKVKDGATYFYVDEPGEILKAMESARTDK